MPNFIYEKLPYLYLLVGAYVVYHFSSPVSKIGLLSGCMLIVASLIIFRLRYEYRVLKIPRR